jgi:hypothetical protein
MALNIGNDFFKALGLGSGAGQAAGGLYGLFGGNNKNPSDVAQGYLNQIPGQTQQYYQPYQQAGRQALGTLQGQYNDLLGGNTYNKLAEGYKESPGYKFRLQQALAGAGNAAAAGGQLGGLGHQQQATDIAEQYANKDFEDYLNHQLGLYGQGLQGEQGLNTMGYGANTDYGNLLAQIKNQQAGYSFKGQNAENEGKKSSWGNIFSGIGSALPFLFL